MGGGGDLSVRGSCVGINRLPGESRLVIRTAGTAAKGILAINENIGRHRPKQQWHPDWKLYRVVQGHQVIQGDCHWVVCWSGLRVGCVLWMSILVMSSS